jgi:hypothetical protein
MMISSAQKRRNLFLPISAGLLLSIGTIFWHASRFASVSAPNLTFVRSRTGELGRLLPH